jgi:hypothetical protein
MLLSALAMTLEATASVRAETPQEIVAGADKIRNPGQPFRLFDTLVEFVNGQPRDRSVLRVFAKEDADTGQFNNLVQYIEPTRDRGKVVLLYGSKMWFYDPAARTSVRISPQQRLIGQAADGDVITVNLAKDYRAELVGDESLEDADQKNRDCWHLDMTAASENAVYSRVEYWIEQSTHQPVKAKYYADSGRLLKIAYFHRLEVMLGVPRPTDTIIIDAVDPKQVTTMTLYDYQFQDIPDSWFQREFLPHLKLQ